MRTPMAMDAHLRDLEARVKTLEGYVLPAKKAQVGEKRQVEVQDGTPDMDASAACPTPVSADAEAVQHPDGGSADKS